MAAAAKLTQHVRALTWLDDSAPLGSGFGLTTSAAMSVTCASRRYGCTPAKGPIWRSRPSSRLARSAASASAGVARRRKPDSPRFGSSNSFCIASGVGGEASGAHGRQSWHLDLAKGPIWRSRPSSRLKCIIASASAGVVRRRKPESPRLGSSNSFCRAHTRHMQARSCRGCSPHYEAGRRHLECMSSAKKEQKNRTT